MKSKVKVIKLTVSVLFFITMFIPFNLIAQSQDRQYPQETLALRLSRIAKDYKKNIVFDPGQSKETIPALNLKQADVTLALTRSLSNTSFVFKQMTDGSFVVSKDNATKKEGSSNQKGKGSLSGIVLDEKGVDYRCNGNSERNDYRFGYGCRWQVHAASYSGRNYYDTD